MNNSSGQDPILLSLIGTFLRRTRSGSGRTISRIQKKFGEGVLAHSGLARPGAGAHAGVAEGRGEGRRFGHSVGRGANSDGVPKEERRRYPIHGQGSHSLKPPQNRKTAGLEPNCLKSSASGSSSSSGAGAVPRHAGQPAHTEGTLQRRPVAAKERAPPAGLR